MSNNSNKECNHLIEILENNFNYKIPFVDPKVTAAVTAQGVRVSCALFGPLRNDDQLVFM